MQFAQLGAQPYSALKDMQAAFGLVIGKVNDIAEEQNLTNFLILVDTVVTLALNWDSVKASFRRSAATGGPRRRRCAAVRRVPNGARPPASTP